MEERVDIIRVDHTQEEDHHGWQCNQNAGRQPSLCGSNSDLPADFEALPDYTRELVQNLCQIASRIFLDQHSGDKETDVNDWDSIAEIQKCIPQRQSKVLL